MRRQREGVLRRRLRRRAGIDACLILLATAGASLLAVETADRLLGGLAVLSVGILLFVIRRGHDIAHLVEAGRWREAALAGRGISIAQWHAGEPLARWNERSPADPFARSATPDGASDQQVDKGPRGGEQPVNAGRDAGRAAKAAGAGARPDMGTAAGAPDGRENSDSREDAG